VLSLRSTAVIVALTALPRLVVALAFGAVPYSDFAAYHRFASALAHGQLRFELVATQDIGYPALLAMPYALFGDATRVAYLVNVAAAGVLVCLAYRLGERLGPGSGRASAILVAMWPEHIVFSGLVASENFHLPALVGGLYSVLRALDSEAGPAQRKSALVGGALFGLANAIRAATGVGLVGLFAWLLIARRRRAVAGWILVGLIATTAMYSGARKVLGDPVKRGGLACSLLFGTNQASRGHWNESDSYLFFSLHEQSAGNETLAAARIAASRLLGDPLGALSLFVDKVDSQWLTHTETVYWLTVPGAAGPRAPMLAAHANAAHFAALLTALLVFVLVGVALLGREWRRAVPPLAMVATGRHRGARAPDPRGAVAISNPVGAVDGHRRRRRSKEARATSRVVTEVKRSRAKSSDCVSAASDERRSEGRP
jgi:hypothetical protein